MRFRHRFPRRAATLAGLITTLLAGVLVPAGVASADSSSQLTIVGTSDVSDSGLMNSLVIPEFEKAYPQFTASYVPLGTGAAINYAEAGTASALIVHAPSLENQFVANGYSNNDSPGVAIFWGDYVLLGPKSDPAGVMQNASNNIVQALEDIAAAGAAGKADFVSRGGTPGTVVQEHAIWALTSGVTTCTVSSTNGGGDAPSTVGGACPSSPSYPSWYHTTGLTQGPNIEAANACNFPNAAGGNDCYVFTDRGTYDCLMSAACAGGNTSPTNLQIVTQNESSSAPGGGTLLVNTFHAYAVNPAKFAGDSNVQLNTPAAEDLITFLTSPGFQAQLASYLAPDAPFNADAAPALTESGLPASTPAGKPITITGTLTNAVPGTPALAGVKVTVSEVGGGLPAGIPVASTTTLAEGTCAAMTCPATYKVTFVPPSSGSYQVSTPQITQVEYPSLSPQFSDILQPATTSPASVSVVGVVPHFGATAIGGTVLASGSVLPGTGHAAGTVTLRARRAGSTGAYRVLATDHLASTDTNFVAEASLAAGRWQLEATFADGAAIAPGSSSPVTVRVGKAGPTHAAITAVTRSGGRARVTAKLWPPAAKGATVTLLGLATNAGSLLHIEHLATIHVGRSATTVTVTAALPGSRQELALVYHPGARRPVGLSRLVVVP